MMACISPFFSLLIIRTVLAVCTSCCQDDFERPPVSYSLSAPSNAISRLQTKIDDGTTTMKPQQGNGFLEGVLSELNIDIDSQVLVFSKTSLQQTKISPRNPRAIYFNDDIYVGFVPTGDVLELSVADPDLGTVFYTLKQDNQTTPPKFERRIEHCLICHSTSRTESIPGHLARSLYVDRDGQPILSVGSRIVDHTTPLENRWGGWYVSGQHGKQTHLGNLVLKDRDIPASIENTEGRNLADLSSRIEADRYLSKHSDIVALMVLDHQLMVHNRMAKASIATRLLLIETDSFDADQKLTPAASSRIRAIGDRVIEALLLVDEYQLKEPIRGSSNFSKSFPQKGIRDQHGRSLRALNLETRLFEYPCSYLIYTDAFMALPVPMKEYVVGRLRSILRDVHPDPKFDHLDKVARRAIWEILTETHPDFAEASHSQGDSSNLDVLK